MPNEYSIQIHNYLQEKLTAIEQKLAETHNDNPLLEGQLNELLWIRKYLSENIDLKDFRYY